MDKYELSSEWKDLEVESIIDKFLKEKKSKKEEFLNNLSKAHEFNEDHWYEVVDKISGLCKSKNTPIEILHSLKAIEESWIKREIAFNPKASLELLEELIEENDSSINEGIARNPITSSEILEQISLRDSYNNNYIVLHPNISNETLNRIKGLQDDEWEEQTKYGLEQRKLPSEWRSLLYPTKVEKMLKEKDDIEEYIFEILIKDESRDIRAAIAENKSVSKKFLDILNNDEDWVVKTKLRERDIPTEWKSSYLQNKYNSEELELKISKEITQSYILNILSYIDNFAFNKGIAKNPNTPYNALQRLYKNDNCDEETKELIRSRIEKNV